MSQLVSDPKKVTKRRNRKERQISGNTKKSATKKSRRERYRSYQITINNPVSQEIKDLKSLCRQKAEYYIASREHEDEENKTMHIHCYFILKNQMELKSLKKMFPRAHIEISSADEKRKKANINYLTKEGHGVLFRTLTFKEKLLKKVLKTEYKKVVWKDFQLKVFKLINEYNGDRVINWFWEPDGNIGKSYVAKYIAIKYNAIIVDGKKNDIFNQVNAMIVKEEVPKIIIIDIPRYNIDIINYGVIEKLKDGFLYSGKYEGGCCIFPRPLVIAFSNSEPDYPKMSSDRWNVIRISQTIF